MVALPAGIAVTIPFSLSPPPPRPHNLPLSGSKHQKFSNHPTESMRRHTHNHRIRPPLPHENWLISLQHQHATDRLPPHRKRDGPLIIRIPLGHGFTCTRPDTRIITVKGRERVRSTRFAPRDFGGMKSAVGVMGGVGDVEGNAANIRVAAGGAYLRGERVIGRIGKGYDC